MGNYLSIPDANIYIDPNPYIGAKWQLFDDYVKAGYIDYAEQQIDNILWVGEKTALTQQGEFPRDLDTIMTGARWDNFSLELQNRITLFDDAIPKELENAVCEVIIYTLRTKSFDKLVGLQEINVDQFSAGSVSFDFNLDKGWVPLGRGAWKILGFLSLAAWNARQPRWLERI